MTSARGFTLVEILVALAVVAVVSVTIVSSVSGMIANVDHLSDRTQLDLLARALADDIRLKGMPDSGEGSFDSHPDYRWTIALSGRNPAEIEKQLNLREYRIEVVSPAGRRVEMTYLGKAASR